MRIFTAHPASVDETYFEHLVHAMTFGARMIWGGVACLVHGLIPGLFVKTGSRTIAALHQRMGVNRKKDGARVGGSANDPSLD